MTKPNWTPGPWKIGSRYTENGVYDKAGNLIANTHSSHRNFDRENQIAEQNANAHLIAAAPDMYEALEDIIGDTEFGCHRASYIKARAALAKARGE